MIGDFDLIKQEFEDILVYSQAYPFSLNAEELMKDWEKAKAPFIKAFGGRTFWRSERPIKVQLSEEVRRRRFDEFIETVAGQGVFDDDRELYQFLKDNREGFFDNKVIVPRPDRYISEGSKLLKACKRFDIEPNMVRWIQDTASRYLQEDKVEGYLYLSVDPKDFLTLSENNSKWTSCHSLDGDYRGGNLSYMVDNTTVVAYLASGTMEHLKCMPKSMKWYDKKWRMLVHVNKQINVYYNKQYPFRHDLLLIATDRMVKQLFLNEQFTEPMEVGFRTIMLPTGEQVNLDRNGIFAGFKTYDAADVICAKDYIGYADLLRSTNYTPIASINSELFSKYRELAFDDDQFEDDAFHKAFDITIGAPVTCPCCGEGTLSKDNSFLCNMCIAEKDADEDFYCFCSGCGRHIYDEDEAIEINGEIYCVDCQIEMEGIEEEYDEED